MNFIDTAEMYGGGHAEELVGKALSGIRHKVFVASKFNPENNSYDRVIRAAEGSLKRLRTDYLDLYQLHWPNPHVKIEETLDAMRELVRQGKVRYVGVSNMALTELVAARSSTNDIVSIQMEYNLFERTIEHDVLPYCQEERVTVLAYSPLDRGSVLEDGFRSKLLQSLARKYERSSAQIALRWLLSRPSVIVIVKSASLAHTLENAAASDFELSCDDLVAIDQAFAQRVVYAEPARIRITRNGDKKAYGSIAEALRNPQDLIPAPEAVAIRIRHGKTLRPLKVTVSEDTSGTYEYDLVDNQLFYWAWLIANGMEEPIPVSVK